MNVEQITADFGEYQRTLNLAEGTVVLHKGYLYIFFSYLEEQEGINHLTEVDSKLIMRFQIYLSNLKNTKGNNYSINTQNCILSTVRQMYKFLRRKGEVFYDPTSGIKQAKLPKTLPKNILSIAEVELLLSKPNIKTPIGIRDRAILEVLYGTGIRQAECIGIDFNDLNFDDRTIFIRKGKGSKDRVVPMTKQSKRWLLKYIEKVRPLVVAEPLEQAVFLNKYGSRLGKQGLWTMVKRRVRETGITKSISPHTLRHSVSTHMVDNGCDIRVLQELLGHSSVNTTAIYVSVSARRLKTAVQKYHPRELIQQVA